MSDKLEQLAASSALFGGNAALVEGLYERYLREPDSVPAHWRRYFDALEGSSDGEVAHGPLREELARRAVRAVAPPIGGAAEPVASAKQGAVARLIQVYGLRGHLIADLDPLGLWQRPTPAVLRLDYFGLGEADLDTEFHTGGLAGIPERMRLGDLLEALQRIFCGRIGIEFAHVSKSSERLWLQNRFAMGRTGFALSSEEKRRLLQQLTAAEGIERYLHTRYVGQKRFSLEGGESMIPLIDDLIQQAGTRDVEECVIGMAHRGRLNVLVNVLGKSPAELFSEFEGGYDPKQIKGSGDVKYHKGFSADIRTPGRNVHVALAFNPSHLEIVDPVVQGSVRARQRRRGDMAGHRVVPILIHGDAAFAGQGVVMETLQMSQARGFRTGGTIHIICNNQIGFTTSDPQDARSTPYCSDVAKMVEAPILHVNADDPEAVIFATRLGFEYRMEFHKDVVIDLVCYRRHGHNEADEPAVTQPVMYGAIRKHPSARDLYARRLAEDGIVAVDEAEKFMDEYRKGLDEGKAITVRSLGMIGNKYTVDWSRYVDAAWTDQVDTGVPLERLGELTDKVTRLPEGFELHPRIQRLVPDRRKMAAGEMPVDWGYAETMAYATILTEGHRIRLIGQDTGRGTFFHRHAILYNQKDGERYVPLQHLGEKQANFTVVDSLLSEEAVLGFEYGYATTDPESLVIWEAQFGDFVNGAQVVIDQFISSGQAKWGRICGLTMFLPHGYEGQGPEHSSARLERFLQLCAEHNIQVCVPSTPAQMFHMLRRQVLRAFRAPLIVMTPKSLLRHKLSASNIEELVGGAFETVIDEIDDIDPAAVKRVVFCSGKVYFDLLETRRKAGIDDIAVVRIEQLYPFPTDEYAAVMGRYGPAREIVWCQEEPQNQGAWYQIRHRLHEPLSDDMPLRYAGRESAAAPASGIYQMHVKEQQALVEQALGVDPASLDSRKRASAGRDRADTGQSDKEANARSGRQRKAVRKEG